MSDSVSDSRGVEPDPGPPEPPGLPPAPAAEPDIIKRREAWLERNATTLTAA